MIFASVILDSVNTAGNRLTTFQVCVHRYVLAEVNTHRALSRNWRSSRAVPTSKLIAEVLTKPAMPLAYERNKPGMQGGAELSERDVCAAQRVWIKAAFDAADRAESISKIGLHKSWANRIIEPFLYVHGVISATELDNFYALRCHPDAQPEIRALADAMRAAAAASTPTTLLDGEWHIPYVTEEERKEHDIITLLRISSARCARVSYQAHDGNETTMENDVKLFKRLAGSQPIHASPLEHQGRVDAKGTEKHKHANFRGWAQFRHAIDKYGDLAV